MEHFVSGQTNFSSVVLMLDARQSHTLLPHPLRPPPAPAVLPGTGQSAVGAFPHSCAPVPASTFSRQAATGTCSAAPALCSALQPEGAAPHRGTRCIRRAKGYTATGLCPAELSVRCSEVLRPAPLPARIVCSRGGGSQHCWTAGGAARPCGSEPPAMLLLPNACADRGARSTWGCCCGLVPHCSVWDPQPPSHSSCGQCGTDVALEQSWEMCSGFWSCHGKPLLALILPKLWDCRGSTELTSSAR